MTVVLVLVVGCSGRREGSNDVSQSDHSESQVQSEVGREGDLWSEGAIPDVPVGDGGNDEILSPLACGLIPTGETELLDDFEIGRSSVSALLGGGGVASWVAVDAAGHASGIRSTVFGMDGGQTVSPFWVSGPGVVGDFSEYGRPGVSALSPSGFIVGWKEQRSANSVQAMPFSESGEALSPSVVVASESEAGFSDDEVSAVRTDDGYAFLWARSDGVVLMRFDSERKAAGEPECFGGASADYAVWGEPYSPAGDPAGAAWSGGDMYVAWLVQWGDPLHGEVLTGVFGTLISKEGGVGPVADVDGSPLVASRHNPQVVAVPDGAMVFVVRDGADVWGRLVGRDGMSNLPVQKVTQEEGMQYMAAARLNDKRAVLAWANCSGTVSARLVAPPMNPVGDVARHMVGEGEPWSCDTPPGVAVLNSGQVVVLSKYVAAGGKPSSKVSFFAPSPEGCIE